MSLLGLMKARSIKQIVGCDTGVESEGPRCVIARQDPYEIAIDLDRVETGHVFPLRGRTGAAH